MSTSDNGGPAFPTLGKPIETGGMTLRDYFAAKAMTGCLPGSMTAIRPEEYAIWAYRMADAMLKVRKS